MSAVGINNKAEAKDTRTTEVNATLDRIPKEWKNFLEKEDLLESLEQTLGSVYDKHYKNNAWQCAPEAEEVFQWMACPPRTVSAIVLLKEPMPKNPLAAYRSTGFALGVERQNKEATIKDCPTVSKTIEILHKIRDAERHVQRVRTRYRTNINPQYLSERGILLLNLSLTRGPNYGDDDFDIWWPFMKELLSSIEPAAGVDKIAVIQLYNNARIQSFLKGAGAKCATYRPGFMDVNAGGSSHVACFQDGQIKEFVDGIRKQGQEQHLRIVRVMAKEVIDGSSFT